MSSSDLFTTVTLTDRVILKPEELAFGTRDVLTQKLRSKYEGACSQFGFVKPGTLEVTDHTPGRVQTVSLNGDIVYKTSFVANVCNPQAGQLIQMHVINKNRFGVMGECTTQIQGKRVVVLEVVLPKHLHDASPEASVLDLDTLEKGQTVFVEVLGRKYELGDKKICVIGKVVSDPNGGHTVESQDPEDLSAAEEEEEEDAVAEESSESDDDSESDDTESEEEDEVEEEDEEDKQSGGAVESDSSEDEEDYTEEYYEGEVDNDGDVSDVSDVSD